MTQAEVDAGMVSGRAQLEEAGYSRWVSDDVLYGFVYKILEAAENVRKPEQVQEREQLTPA